MIGRSSSYRSRYRRSRCIAAPPATPRQRPPAVDAAERLVCELLEPLDRDRVAVALPELGLHRERELVGAIGREAGGDQRARHQTFRERQAVLVAERHRLAVAAVGHRDTASRASAWSASRISSTSRSWTPTGTSSLSANTTSTPRSSAASATTSIAAALISTRNTSASTRATSSRSASRRARLPETSATSTPCSSRRWRAISSRALSGAVEK